MIKIKIKESQLQSTIEDMLKIYEKIASLIYIKNNSGATKVGDSFIRFGKAGSPDFLIFFKGGKTLHLEVKVGRNRQTVSQVAYQHQCEALGHMYKVVRSSKEVQELLHEESILRSA